MLLRSIRVLFFNKKFKNKEKNTEKEKEIQEKRNMDD